jgi:ABC-type oligopeptide transport system ATPase subunit
MGYKVVQDKPIIIVYEIRLDLNKKKFIVSELPMEFSPHQGFEIAYSKAQELISKEDVNSRIGMIEYNFDKSQEKDVYLLTISYGNKLGNRIANVIINSKTGEILSAITKERPLKHPPLRK